MPNRLSRYCEGVMEAGWLLAVILSPLFFNVYSSRVFEPDKIALVRSLALVILAAWLIKLGSEGGPRYEALDALRGAGWREWLRVPLLLPVGALVVIYLVSTIASVSSYASLFGSYQRLQGTFSTFSYLIIFGAIAANLRRRAQAERLLTAVIITSLPISLYGIIQHYRLDPLPWGGDTSVRVTGNMGNAIFLAAYLIMSVLVVLGRVVISFRDILTRTEDFGRNMARATVYVFILAVNLVAIYFTGSRGPWLGLLAGLFFFFVLLALYWRVRALALGTILGALALGAFLITLNVPNGPLQSLRSVPGLGRLGGMLEEIEGRSGTGRVRALIWSGVVELMTPHAPLQTPDGQADAWNFLRPLIGYGPESLYVSFNRFYPPELGQLEARNATPDRSHNETFDALAITGLIGLGVYMAVFTALFYYGLKWVGFIDTPRRRNVFLLLLLGGGAGGAVTFVAWQGPDFFGVGLPFGMLLGLIAFLTLYALVGMRQLEAQPENGSRWQMVALISLLSAAIAHFVEIHFGIAIVSTRTHFWTFVGLMFVLGYVWPQLSAAAARPATVRPAAARPTFAQRRRAGRPSPSDAAAQEWEVWKPVLASAGLMLGVIITLGFDFISNPTQSKQAGDILIRALLAGPVSDPGRQAFTIFGMLGLTWGLGSLIVYLEETAEKPSGQWLSPLAGTLALTFMVGGLSWLVSSGQLASLAAYAPTNLDQLIVSTQNVAGVLTTFYFSLLLLVLFWGAALPAEWPGSSAWPVLGVNVLWYLALPVLVVVLAVTQNLQMVQADIIYKTGLQFDEQNQPQLSIPIYEKAISLVPSQDYYYLFLGRSYLNATAAITDTLQRESVLQQAEQQLFKARELNPLNTDHSANLARLNRQWAALAEQDATRTRRLTLADEYYAQALSLSPNNAGLWNEWAVLKYQQMGDGDGAQAKLDQSFALDAKFDQTYQIQGDLYLWRAGGTPDPTAQQELYLKAAEAYRGGIQAAQARGGDSLPMRISLAGAYATVNQVEPAIAAYQELLPLTGPDLRWQVLRAIAELYWRTANVDQTRLYVQQALEAAPETEKAGLQAFLDALPATP